MDAVVREERVGLVIGFLYKLGHFWIVRKVGFYCAAGGYHWGAASEEK
jgi:hypothetical protein